MVLVLMTLGVAVSVFGLVHEALDIPIVDLDTHLFLIDIALYLLIGAAGFYLQRRVAYYREMTRALQDSEEEDAYGSSASGGAFNTISQLLRLLQKEAHFLDFLMGDMTSYSQQEMAEAMRGMHRRLRSAFANYVHIMPIADGVEGTYVSMPDDTHRQNYHFIGSVDQEAADGGILKHRGWRMENKDGTASAIVAPAVIEIKPEPAVR